MKTNESATTTESTDVTVETVAQHALRNGCFFSFTASMDLITANITVLHM